MDAFETRLARGEIAIADGEENFEEMRQGMDEFYLTTAISIVESLILFKKPEKTKPKDQDRKEKSGGDHDRGKETIKKTKGAKKYKVGERPPLKCFFYECPHKARKCLKKAKLSALMEEIEEQEREEERVGSL
ncbi:unnamed protein product [Cuscuta campestris]|uniref:Uncharacterized protein n=1 Tax=Cuscuta campestris TaxID=132261 RepID=A0A484MJY8_9ASTE|nr:unnamed protein product [Cuscuta campestris]